ncbi:hypothetical protein KKA47_06210 [bacterium]|nr:hypothetical protein [bacterium]
MKRFIISLVLVTFVVAVGVTCFTPPANAEVWEYTAKRMKPPKNDKWAVRWNELGQKGWELVTRYEHYYIFKRPAVKKFAPVVFPEVKKEEPKPVVKEKKAEKAKKKK